MGGEVSSQQYINKQRLIQQQKHQQHLRQSSSIDSNFDINPSLNTSGPLSGPIGGSATYSGHRSQGVPVQTYPKEIVIVSKGDSEAEDQKFVFPPPFKPLIPIGHETLSPAHPQLNAVYILKIGSKLQENLKFKSDFIHSQQTVVVEIIREIDSLSSFITNQLLAERHKKFIKVTDSFNKLSEIDILISKIDSDLESCLHRVNLLNGLLPSELRLEPFTGDLNQPDS